MSMSPFARAGWFAGTLPEGLGARDGRLKPCPDTPNCVSSQTTGKAALAPFAYRGSHQTAWLRLVKIVSALPRTKITQRTDHYLRAEATSRVFGFVDDIEFLLDENASVIHVRSASRLGYSDLGVNRQRVEQIRSLFAQGDTAPE